MKKIAKAVMTCIVIGLLFINSGYGISKKDFKRIKKLNEMKQETLNLIKNYQKVIVRLEAEIIQIQTLIGYINGDIKILDEKKKPEKK